MDPSYVTAKLDTPALDTGFRKVQIAKRMFSWWPFDGLDIPSPTYEGKHAGIEINPSAVRNGSQQSDEHDAMQTCLAVSEADKSGYLIELSSCICPIDFGIKC